jgi:hypothetical protein
MGQDGGRK